MRISSSDISSRRDGLNPRTWYTSSSLSVKTLQHCLVALENRVSNFGLFSSHSQQALITKLFAFWSTFSVKKH